MPGLHLVEDAPEPVVAFTVYGHASPAGSKKAFPIRKNGEFVRMAVSDDAKNVKQWRAQVAQVAGAVMLGATLLESALQVELDFYRARNKGHYGTGRNAGVLKDSAPTYPTTRPDALKLARAVEDSLTGVVFRDDSQIVVELLRKLYGEPERVEVRIYTLA